MERNSLMRKLPNIITVIRIIMVPVFVCVFFYVNPYWALGVYLFAALSDLADGYLARKYEAISNFGKLMDPFADKALSVSALVCLYIGGLIPWQAIAIIAAKELLLVIGGLLMLRFKITVSANKVGKYTAFITNVAMCLCFFHDFVRPYDWYLLYVALGLQLFALVQYGYCNIKVLLKKKNEN